MTDISEQRLAAADTVRMLAFGIIALLVVLVAIFGYHLSRELMGLPFHGSPLYHTYEAIYPAIMSWIVITFGFMSFCWSVYYVLKKDSDNKFVWALLLIASVVSYAIMFG